jgi:hypothetical protein
MRIRLKQNDKYHFREGISAIEPGGVYSLEFETEEEAKKADRAARQWLYTHGLEWAVVVNRKGLKVECRKLTK